jgi:hypothetical protein
MVTPWLDPQDSDYRRSGFLFFITTEACSPEAWFLMGFDMGKHPQLVAVIQAGELL